MSSRWREGEEAREGEILRESSRARKDTRVMESADLCARGGSFPSAKRVVAPSKLLSMSLFNCRGSIRADQTFLSLISLIENISILCIFK
jgi:hypothetical protein